MSTNDNNDGRPDGQNPTEVPDGASGEQASTGGPAQAESSRDDAIDTRRRGLIKAGWVAPVVAAVAPVPMRDALAQSAHVDTGHGDVSTPPPPHNDHSDHADQHVDSSTHADSATHDDTAGIHADGHSDSGPHGDQTLPHGDSPGSHGDTTLFHTDSHFDSPGFPPNHQDSAIHTDSPAQHSDQPAGPHTDTTSHQDGHSDGIVGHVDSISHDDSITHNDSTPHVDAAHADSHVDTGTGHIDISPPHTDNHQDDSLGGAHADNHGDFTSGGTHFDSPGSHFDNHDDVAHMDSP